MRLVCVKSSGGSSVMVGESVSRSMTRARSFNFC